MSRDNPLFRSASDSLVRREAVALRTPPGKETPEVVAKGYGTVAHNIIDQAREHGIYIHESPELVEMLMKVDLDAEIPPALYAVVAELLAWLYGIESRITQDNPTTNS